MGCKSSKGLKTENETSKKPQDAQQLLRDLAKQYESAAKRESSFGIEKSKENELEISKVVHEDESKPVITEEILTKPAKAFISINEDSDEESEYKSEQELPESLSTSEIIETESVGKDELSDINGSYDPENDSNYVNAGSFNMNRVRKDSFMLYKSNDVKPVINVDKKVKVQRKKKKKVNFALSENVEIINESKNIEKDDFEVWLSKDLEESDDENEETCQKEVRNMINKRKSMAAVKIGQVERLRRKFEANCKEFNQVSLS